MISDRSRQLMHEHQQDADTVLKEEFHSAVPSHLLYWLVVVAGAFGLNLLALVLLAP